MRIDAGTTVVDEITTYPRTNREQHSGNAGDDPTCHGRRRSPVTPALPRRPGKQQQSGRLNPGMPVHEPVRFVGMAGHGEEGEDAGQSRDHAGEDASDQQAGGDLGQIRPSAPPRVDADGVRLDRTFSRR